MKIGEIGNTFNLTRNVDYISDQTFIDFDFLILDLDFIFNNLNRDYGDYSLKRKEAFIEFITYKRVPLIILAPTINQKQLSIKGQIRNVKLDEIIPIPPFDVEKVSGQAIEVRTNTPFTEFLLRYKQLFRYNSYFTLHDGKTIVEVPHTKKVLAFYNETCVFLPRLVQGNSIRQSEETFLNELTALISNLHRKEELSLPKWAENYSLPLEEDVNKQINEIAEQIAQLHAKFENVSSELATITRKKLLFTASGDSLESEVRTIFELLGFEILEAEPNRDDLIVKYKEQIAVVEIKGVNGSSAEKHATQLEKWVSTFHEKHEILPKGILMVNSFREDELDARNVVTFPNQMLAYSEKRDHCLMTTLQFLGLYFNIRLNPSRKEELIETLFTTVGVYTDFSDWKEFISKSSK